jgi:hypothetical protein
MDEQVAGLVIPSAECNAKKLILEWAEYGLIET